MIKCRKMKRVFALMTMSVLILTTVSCKDDDYETIESVNKVVIDSVSIPNDTMQIYSIMPITTYSDYTGSCEGFYGYDYERYNFSRYVTSFKYKTDGTCESGTESRASKINFQPQNTGTYTFKFWQGTSADEDIWLEKTVVVVE